jgi:hypothetical protein
MRSTYRILIDKSEHKRKLGRPRRRMKDDIKIYFKEIQYEGMD